MNHLKINHLLFEVGELEKNRPKDIERKKHKRDTFENINTLYGGGKIVLNDFKRGIFPIQPSEHKGHPGVLALHPLDLAI